MDKIVLKRFAYTPYGTFGVLEFDDKELYTLEPPWNDNLPNVSCIPTGTYPIFLTTYRHNTPDPRDDYATYELRHVPGRQNIKFHRGNTIRDTHGCPLVGMSLGDGWSVLNSTGAMDCFMHYMDGIPEAELTICFDPKLMAV